MTGSDYVKSPVRVSAILKIEIDGKYCFLWSISASLHFCQNNYPNRVLNNRQPFDKLNIRYFDFSDGFKCHDVHKLENSNIFSINIIDINFCQDQNKFKNNLIPNGIIKKISDKVIVPLISKNQNDLNKNLILLLGKHDRKNFGRK